MTAPDLAGPGIEQIIVYEPVQSTVDKRIYWTPWDRYLGIWDESQSVTCCCGSKTWLVHTLTKLEDDDEDGLPTQQCYYLCSECGHNLARAALPPPS